MVAILLWCSQTPISMPAAAWAVRSRFQNTGQSCIAAKRIVVEEAVAEVFVGKMLNQVHDLRLGPPTEPEVTVGPLAREDLRDAVERQVRESVAQGARILAGGRVPSGPGFFYEPTVLDHVRPGMPVLQEEVFGPAVPCCEHVTVRRRSGLPMTATMAWVAPYGLLTSSVGGHLP